MNKFNLNLTRRHFMTTLALSPLWLPSLARSVTSPHTAHLNQQRIAVLEWLPVELLMALGVMPLAVADVHKYHLWVQQPELTAQVVDLGSRTEPNMELLQQLSPSLILYSQNYGPSIEKMSSIAPTMGFSFNSSRRTPLAQAFYSLKMLAERLDLHDQYTLHLRRYHQQMERNQQRLRLWDDVPILLFTLLDNDHAMVFGQGGLFQDVLDQLGLRNAWQGKTNAWGSQIIGLEQLATIQEARAVFFSHGNEALFARVKKTPLWQALPFVRRYPVIMQPAVWFYGATLSAMRFSDLLATALEKQG
ncbi:Fe(3+)-hydroxamate ABC transporter substrate-binding protein FhuD [Xenorhabdus szentirmaii]|uniref:Iron(3+)-hydroxamate-binding protein fhuD n=1 Tax=Xenorhabdus szentirmaii DSM 16338 TaxID=1427518 RepID=W1IYA9_9GAMM|nr:Fe(3+)-hydroxamate ABC transporter substrate-binding protein FhuD [Xenorhabdus szentirmaii]PHM31593.1 iron compound ABC transporter iron compound-binding protein [Xenorhabdus szentirmaii DSM 16338]PHM42024.1 iron compound ABC transporter iron compound-binding protein [Xenorhabdus szentirmaii]CDL83409.1 Iron(3+)-hydroxamate-binding protein fhuD [Xenorhabdus szentirmaii DSM 16338]